MPEGDDAASGSENEFDAIRKAAKDALSNPEIVSAAPSDAGIRPGKGPTESYNDELSLDMQAFRKLRSLTFIAISVASGSFLVILAAAIIFYLHSIGAVIFGGGLSALRMWAINMSWHVIVFVGVMLTLLAVVPMTLGLALVKMVSNGRNESRDEVALPSSQLVKFITMCMKGGS